MLLVYQHAKRDNEKKKWLATCEAFKAACGGAHVSGIRSPTIAGDVALLWATHDDERSTLSELKLPSV
jgi:hypothetical protein